MNKRKRANCQQQSTMNKQKSANSQQQVTTTRRRNARNWTDLPRDVIILIFGKLGILEILRNAQNVCSLWRKLAKEPILYRSLDIAHVATYFFSQRKFDGIQRKFEHIAKEAVNRSSGQLVKLSSCDMVTRELLLYVNRSNSNSLRCLQLGAETCLSQNNLVEVVKHLHLLEELELWFGHFPKLVIDQVGRSCPKLTSFRLCKYQNFVSFDKEASCIVQNMPQLHHLSLVGSKLTNKGLQTILDGCAHLQRLDFRHSSGVEVDKIMFERSVGKIRDVSLPDESSFGSRAISETIDGMLVRKETNHWVCSKQMIEGKCLHCKVCDAGA